MANFEFELKENGTVLHTVSTMQKVRFTPELTFTEETRTFTITEKAGDVAKVEYDPNAYEYAVVKDNGQGQSLSQSANRCRTTPFSRTFIKLNPAKENYHSY